MSARSSSRRTPLPRLLGAVAVCAGLVAAGQVPAAGDAPASISPVGEPSVVSLGDGDRVEVTPAQGRAPRVLEPLPGADGTAPGLLVGSDRAGTTVQALDGTAAPTVVAGSAPAAVEAATAEDLVELHLDSIARDGRPASADVTVYDVDTGAVQLQRRIPGDPGAPCTTASFAESSCVLVPPGTYSVMAFVNTMPAARPSTARERTVQNVSLVGDPQVEVTGPRTFTLDARLARAVTVDTPDDRTETVPGGAMQLGFYRTAANGPTISRVVRPTSMLDQRFYLQPTEPVTVGGMETLTRLRLEAPDIELTAPRAGALHPEYYDPVWFSDLSSDFPVYDGHDRLPVVDVGHATAADLAGRRLRGAIAVAERSDGLSVADQSNAAAAAGASLVVISNDGPGDDDDPNGTGTRLQVPTVRVTRAEGLALTRLPGHARVGVRGESASPYLYDLVLKERGGIPRDLSYRVAREDTAQQVRELHGQPTIGSTFSEAAYQYQPGDTFAISRLFPLRGGARARTEYRLPDPDTRWTYAVATPETTYNALFPHPPVTRMLLSDPDLRAYTTTGRSAKPIGTAPVTSSPSRFRPVQRSGDRMRVVIDGFVDADGNHGTSYTGDSGMRTHLEIRADDVVVGETDYLPSGTAVLPPGESRVEVSFVADNPQSWTQLSTHTESVWSFDSSTVDGGDVVDEPLILADYDVDADLRNRVRPGAHRQVAFHLDLAHAADSSTAPIDDVTLEASYDDGRTWRAARLTRSRDGGRDVVLPRGSGFVSLRLHAADADGSALDQTIIRALYVR